MKANELMIGDWVQFAEGKQMTMWDNTTQFKVGCICQSRIGAIGGGSYTSSNIPIDCIMPVRLTEEMLLLNNFCLVKKWDDINTNLYGWGGLTDFTLHWKTNDRRIIESFGGAQVDIEYVHELQNFLRCIGLNQYADNFKIKED